MGPDAANHSSSKSYHHAQTFVTNHTNKAKYRDSVETFIAMLRHMSIPDAKAQEILRSVSLILYTVPDDYAKETI